MVVDKVADMEVATISNGVATITNEPAVGLLWNLNPDWKFPSYSSLMFRYKLQRKSCKYDFSRQKCYNFVFLQKVLFLLLNKENTALWQDLLLSFAVWMKTRKPHFDCPSFWLLIFQHFQRIFSNAFYLFLFAPVCHMPFDISGIEFGSTKRTLFSRWQWGKGHTHWLHYCLQFKTKYLKIYVQIFLFLWVFGFGLGFLGCRIGVRQRGNTCSALMRQCRWQQTINFHQLNLKG